MSRYVRSKYEGVFYQPSATRKHQGRPDQVWYIVYSCAGKRKWEKVGWTSEGYTAAYAQQLRAERIRWARGHEEAVPARRTFDEAWAIAWERHLCRLSGADNALSLYRLHVGPHLGGLHLTSITAAHVEKVKDAMLKRDLSPQTVRHALALIRRVYNCLAKWGLYSGAVPTTSVPMPKADNRRTRYLTAAEAQALLAALKQRSIPVWRMALMSLFTGLRAGEIMKMRGEHVDLVGARARVIDTKTGQDRTVYLPAPVLEMLKEVEIKPGALVFERPKGGTVLKISQVFKRTVRDLGLNDGREDRRDQVVFHTLRHTFASWLVIQGKGLYLVGTLLGHTTVEMTKRYAHLAPETQRAAVEAIEGYLHGAPP